MSDNRTKYEKEFIITEGDGGKLYILAVNPDPQDRLPIPRKEEHPPRTTPLHTCIT